MSTPQDQGREFEKELANEFGLNQVPGSGSVWYSKLDLSGHGVRWSLKFTGLTSFPITLIDIKEAFEACFGLGGDGAIPIWAVRMGQIDEDFIVMRKEDFKLMQMGYAKLLNIISEDKPQVAARKKRASQPELLRDEE